jgi:hypothetical protein
MSDRVYGAMAERWSAREADLRWEGGHLIAAARVQREQLGEHLGVSLIME